MKWKREYNVWLIVGGTALVAWLIWRKLKQTGSDLGSAVNTSFTNPIKTIFG